MKKYIILVGNIILFSAIGFSQQNGPVMADDKNKTSIKVKMPDHSQISTAVAPGTEKLPVGMKARQATQSEISKGIDPSVKKNVNIQVRPATVEEKQ